MVLRGGRSRLIQRPVMKAAITATEMQLKIMERRRSLLYRTDETDQWSLAHIAITAATNENRMDVAPNSMNISQLIISAQFNQ